MNCDAVRVSVDGVGNVNDKIRGRGCFEKAMKAFRYVLDAEGNPVALITVTTKTLPSLKDFMQFLFNNGVRRIHVNPLKVLGRAKNSLICNREKINKTVEEFWYETFGLKLKQNISENTINCGVGKFISIHPDGSIYPCHVLAFPEYCIGNVKNERLNKIINNSKIMHKLRCLNFDEISNCESCFKDLLKKGDCLGVKAQDLTLRKQLSSILH